MYTYPEALNAMEKVANDLFATAKKLGLIDANRKLYISVKADAHTGTASVDWTEYGDLAVTINMPVLPATQKISEKEFDAWAAYLFHEVGHPLFTSKYVWQEAVKANKHALLNALEDVRIEQASIKAGLAANGKLVLTSLISSLMDKATVKSPFDPNEPRNIGWTMSYIGRIVLNGYAMDKSPISDKLDANGPVAKVLTWAIPALGKCADTQDCLDLADRIVAALPKRKPSEPAKGEPAKGEPAKGEPAKGEGEPAKGEGEPSEGEGEGEPSEGEGEPSEGEGEGEPAKGEGEPSEGEGEPSEGEGEPSEGEPSKPSNAGQGNEGLSYGDIHEMPVGPRPIGSQGFSRKSQREATVIQAIRDAANSAEKKIKPLDGYADPIGAQNLANAAGKATRQRAILARVLKANAKNEFHGGRLRGRLDRKALARKAAGSQAIFGRRIYQSGYETDVQVLIDGSSSMSGWNIQAACELAYVVAQAASQVGVACDVCLFNENLNGYGSVLRSITSGKQKPNINKFATALRAPRDGTPLCASLLKAAYRQNSRAAGKRKLLFAITDGGCNYGFEAMVATVAYIEQAMGIEVVNLMIGQMASGAFTNEVAVGYGKDVASVGLEMLAKQLERAA